MIRSARFQNFKALRDVSIDFEPLTFIVGPNGSGKTSILEGIKFYSELFVRFQDTSINQKSIKEYFSKSSNKIMSVKYEFSNSLNYEFSLNDSNSKMVEHSAIVGFPMHANGTYDGKTFAELEGSGENIDAIRAPLFSMRFLQLDAVRLAKPAPPTESNAASIASNGEGLPSFLTDLYQNRPDDFTWIQESLRKVVPTFQRLRFKRVKDDSDKTTILESLVFDFKGALDVPGSMASEGTLIVLGLLSFMVGRDRPNIFLLDDMDRALHPRAQRDLVSVIRDFQKHNPDVQFIATTHSPILLDFARFEEVRMTALDDAGAVVCGKMEDHPRFEEWKETVKAGTFWSLIGERWLTHPETEIEPAQELVEQPS